MEPVIITPAFEPCEALIEAIVGLRAGSGSRIVIVDDGSGPQFAGIFESAARIAGVTVLQHPRNLGKGAALRTGMAHVLRCHAETPGVVTADSDGQHAVDDIRRVADALTQSPSALVLGVRPFSPRMPVARHLANRVARAAVRAVTGISVSDVQTGLRGIPVGCLPHLVAMRSTRYEFEMEMLLWACANAIDIVERPIETIYPGRGRASHFRPVRDSVRVLVVLLRAATMSPASGRRVRAPRRPRTSEPEATSPGRWSAPGSEGVSARSAVRR
jgi:glycosyltransferase involved in cell wall biosynthesis